VHTSSKKLTASASSSKEGFPSPSPSSLLLSSLEDGILILPLAIRHLRDDRDERDEDRWMRVLAFAPPLFGFGHIWTVVLEVVLLPACEASSLSLLFPVNVKEKILYL
jgi:hypothetical protein